MATPEEIHAKYGTDPDWRTGGAQPAAAPAAPAAAAPSAFGQRADDYNAGQLGIHEQYGTDPDWRSAIRAPEEERDYDTGIGYAFMRGLERLRAMPDVAQGDYDELADHYGSMEKWRMSDDDIAIFEDMREQEGWWAKAGSLMMNPRLVLQVVAESLPMMAAPIAGAVAGGVTVGAMTANPLGVAAGAMAGGGIGSYFTEYYASMGEFFGENGVDMTNAQQLKAAFENPELMAGARSYANARGIPIAIFDALSMGLAGKVAAPARAATKAVTGRTLGMGVTSEILTQASFGSAGEAGAQLASTGQIEDELDVLLEGVAEIVPGFVEAGVMSYVDRKAAARKAGVGDPNESPLAALDQPDVPPTDIDQSGKVVSIDGNYTQDELDKAFSSTLADLDEQAEAERPYRDQAERQALDKDASDKQKRDEIERMYADETDRIVSEATGAALESEMTTPMGLPVEGEPVDVSGGIESDTGQILPAGVNPVGGRPLTTNLGEALRGAGVAQPPPPPGGSPGSGLPTPSGSQGAKYNAYVAYEAYATETGHSNPADFAVGELQRAQDEANAAGSPIHVTGHDTGGINRSLQPLTEQETAAGWQTVGRVDPETPAAGPDARPGEAALGESLEAGVDPVALESQLEREEERAAIAAADRPATAEDEFDDSIPYESIKGKPVAEVEWADERLASEDYHGGLDRLVSETQAGGGVVLVPSDELGVTYSGRTPSQNPSWMQSIIAEEGIGRDYVINAVEKAKAGKRLGVKQKRIVEGMLDEIDNPSEYEGREAPETLEEGRARAAAEFTAEDEAAGIIPSVIPPLRPQDRAAPEFALEQEQDGVVPETPAEPKATRQHVDADIGVPGDMFSPGANSQVDLVDEARADARKEGEAPSGMKLIEAKPSDLNALVAETENEIEAFIEKGETMGGLAQTSILAGINKLQMHKHPRATELMQVAQDAFRMYDTGASITASEIKKLTSKISENLGPLEQSGMQTSLLADNDAALATLDAAKLSPNQKTTVQNLRIRTFKVKIQAAYRANELAGKAWQRETKNRPQREAERDAATQAALDMVPAIGQAEAKAIVQKIHNAHIKSKTSGWGMPDGLKRPLGFLTSKSLRDTPIGKNFETFFYEGTQRYEVIARNDKREIALVRKLENRTIEDGGADSLWYMSYDADTTGGIMGSFIEQGQTPPERDTSKPHYSRDNYFTRTEAIAAFEDNLHESDPNTPDPNEYVIDEKNWLREGPNTQARVFSSEGINPKKRVAIDTRLNREGVFISLEEADAKITAWEDNAIQQGKDSRQAGAQSHKDNFNRVIISLFDTTGVWANPYALAGYDVRALDINAGIDVTDFSVQFLEDTFGGFDGKEIYGIMAACPCTTFSNSSTRWRKDRHENTDPVESRKWIEEMWGKKAAEAVDENGDWLYKSAHDYAIQLVEKTIQTLEYFRPQFWVLENPEGRIEQAANLPGPWRTGFQPSNFGDPYTKRTLLWGNFNEDLPTANVEATEGSKMHRMSPSADRAAKRAETPEGFAYSFFDANNYLDTDPVERTMADYWYIAGAVEEAMKAGVTEQKIRDEIYLDLAFDPDTDGTAERQQLQDLIDEVRGGGSPPTAPGTPPAPTTPAAPAAEAEFRPTSQFASTIGMFVDTPNSVPDDAMMKRFRALGRKNPELEPVLDFLNQINTLTDKAEKMGDDRYNFFEDELQAIPEETRDEYQAVLSQMLRFDDMVNDFRSMGETKASAEKLAIEQMNFGVSSRIDIEGVAAPAQAAIPAPAEIDAAANVADPDNASDAQKEAGNYKKGHMVIAGIPITIENPVGTVRHGKLKLKDHYGYIKRTEGADGDNVDVFVNSKAQEDFAGDVYIVDQIFPDIGGFDEHKVMFGYNNLIDARRAYRRNFNKDWKGAGPVTKMTLDEFNKWLAEPGANKTPASHSPVTEAGRKERQAHGKKIKYAVSKDLFNAPTEEWTTKVLNPVTKSGDPIVGDIPDTAPMNKAVTELLKAETFRLRQAVNPAANQDMETLPATEDVVELADVQNTGRIGKIINDLNKEFPLANIKLVNRNDPEVRANLEEQIKMDLSEMVGNLTVPGLYDPNTETIYIFKDRLMGGLYAAMGLTVKKIALHEMTHRGLHVMFEHHKDGTIGELSYQRVMNDIYDRVPAKHKPLLKKLELEYGLDTATYEDDRWIAAEELVANLAENQPGHELVARVVEFVRKFLEQIGVITPKDTWSDQDIRDLIAEAHGALKRNPNSKVANRNATITEEVTVNETGEVFEVERAANDVISDVDKRIDICKKLRNCL